MIRKQVALAIAFAALTGVGSTGCATRGSVSSLEKRVADLESRLDKTEQTAQQALDTAEAADRNADAAAKLATDAARTADAIFKKSVHK